MPKLIAVYHPTVAQKLKDMELWDDETMAISKLMPCAICFKEHYTEEFHVCDPDVVEALLLKARRELKEHPATKLVDYVSNIVTLTRRGVVDRGWIFHNEEVMELIRLSEEAKLK